MGCDSFTYRQKLPRRFSFTGREVANWRLLAGVGGVTIGGVSIVGIKNDAVKTAGPDVPAVDGRVLESQLRQRFDVVEQRLAVGKFTFEMLHPRSADDLINEDEFNRDERLPYWAEIWPSAYVLAERIAEAQGLQPLGLVNGKIASALPRMLELGCGCGLAVMAGLAVGYSVTAIDYYPEALEFVRLNALRNGLPAPETMVVDWRKYPSELVGFDVVVAADVLYERDYCRLVAAAMGQSLGPGGVGLLTDPQRTKAGKFPEECRAQDWKFPNRKCMGP